VATMDWPQRLWVVRHGQSAGNVARDAAEANGSVVIELATRDADVSLSGLGQQQARALGDWFARLPARRRPNVLYASPFVRARQTSEILVQRFNRSLKPCIDERLREKEFGVLDRFTRAGIRERFPELAEQLTSVGKFYFRPPGGESWCDVILRLRSLVEMLRRDDSSKRVLIISHQVIVNCIRYLIEHLDERGILEIDAKADVPNCGVVEYARGRSGLQLVRANFIQPLRESSAPVTRGSDTPGGPK